MIATLEAVQLPIFFTIFKLIENNDRKLETSGVIKTSYHYKQHLSSFEKKTKALTDLYSTIKLFFCLFSYTRLPE